MCKKTNTSTLVIVVFILFFSCTKATKKTTSNNEIPLTDEQNVCFDNFGVVHSENTFIDFREVPIYPKLISIERGANHKTMIRKYSLNDEFQIKHYFRDHIADFDGVDDSIVVLGKTYSVEQLLREREVDYTSHIFTSFSKIYSFNFQSKEYLLLIIDDLQIGISVGVYSNIAILFDVSNKDAKPILLSERDNTKIGGPTPKSYPNYLGDFNKDGILDYLHWGGIL